MSLEERIKSLEEVKYILHQFLTKENINTPTYNKFEETIHLAEIKNPWFTNKNILTALDYWDKKLTYKTVSQWLSSYKIPRNNSKIIGLVLAGNIPMVGLHDCLCCLLLGYKVQIKLSSKDSILIPFFLNLWKEFYPDLSFEFIERLKKYDAVITTGSNNTAKYFEYYFKDTLILLEKNRTSIAIITGKETEEELNNLSKDIFTYFGLGCRNVTQLFIPKDYDINKLFNSFIPFKEVIHHNKYANNYDYNKAIFLLNKDNFWDNNFILLKEATDLYSPIASLYYCKYSSNDELEYFISLNKETIQCVVTNEKTFPFNTISFGETQNPEINDYADGVDTVKFLLSITP